MTFAAFMEAALYGPGGYYAQRPAIGGVGADYFTAPELHPVFGAPISRAPFVTGWSNEARRSASASAKRWARRACWTRGLYGRTIIT